MNEKKTQIYIPLGQPHPRRYHGFPSMARVIERYMAWTVSSTTIPAACVQEKRKAPRTGSGSGLARYRSGVVRDWIREKVRNKRAYFEWQRSSRGGEAQNWRWSLPGLTFFCCCWYLCQNRYPARHLFGSVSRILSRKDLELESVSYGSFQTYWKDLKTHKLQSKGELQDVQVRKSMYVNATTKAFTETCKKYYELPLLWEKRLKAVLALILTFSIPNDGKLSTKSKEDRTMQPSVVNPFRQSGRNQKVRLVPQHTVTAYLPANLRWLSWKASRGWRLQVGRPTLKLDEPCKMSEHDQVTMRIIPLSCATGNVI